MQNITTSGIKSWESFKSQVEHGDLCASTIAGLVATSKFSDSNPVDAIRLSLAAGLDVWIGKMNADSISAESLATDAYSKARFFLGIRHALKSGKGFSMALENNTLVNIPDASTWETPAVTALPASSFFEKHPHLTCAGPSTLPLASNG